MSRFVTSVTKMNQTQCPKTRDAQPPKPRVPNRNLIKSRGPPRRNLMDRAQGRAKKPFRARRAFWLLARTRRKGPTCVILHVSEANDIAEMSTSGIRSSKFQVIGPYM